MMKGREQELNCPHVLILFHVMPTSVNSYLCDSHCLARLFKNMPTPPKHYGIFDSQSFC